MNGTPQSTPQFERWAFERTGTFNTAFNYPTDNTFTNRSYVFGTLDKTNAASGNYTYTFATPLGSTTPYDNAVHFSTADTQRVYIQVAHAVSNVYTAGVGFQDITLTGTAPAYTVTPIAFLARQFVTIEACQKCHGPKNQFMDHGSSYMDTNACVICHSQITNANNGAGGGSRQTKAYMFELWFGNLIHKIHDAQGSSLVKTTSGRRVSLRISGSAWPATPTPAGRPWARVILPPTGKTIRPPSIAPPATKGSPSPVIMGLLMGVEHPSPIQPV